MVIQQKMNMPTQTYRLHDLLRLRRSAWLIVLVTAGCVAMLVWLLTSTATSPASTAETHGGHVPAVGIYSARRSCPECGVVSSTQGIGRAAEGINSGIEVTVRMRDGSSRQFTDTSSANWRVGDRMIIIGSATHVDE